MPLSFSDLPDDILFRVVHFIHPIYIFNLRQVSRRFRNLTLERTIWVDAYRQSDYFLPPGPLSTHSTHDLEALLVHARRLETNWNNPAPQIARHRSLQLQLKGPIRSIRLFRGRYLIAGLRDALVLYDIERSTDWDKPAFVYKPQDTKERFTYAYPGPCFSAGSENAEMYLPVVRASRPKSTIIIWKIDSTQSPTLSKIAEISIRVPFQPHIVIRYGFLAVSTIEGHLMLYHIATRQICSFQDETDTIRDLKRSTFPSGFLFTPHSVLIIHANSSKTVFEHFLLPSCTSATHGGQTAVRTHLGILNEGFTESALISFELQEYTSSCNGTLRLVALFHSRGFLPFTVTLNPDDADMTFDLDPHKHLDVRQSSSFDLLVTTLEDNYKAKALCRTSGTSGWFMYDLKLDSCNEPIVKAGFLEAPVDLHFIDEYVFDGFKGRICASYTLDSSRVDIWDLV